MSNENNDLVSIKVKRESHLLLKHCRTLNVNMQDFASKAIKDRFKEMYPLIYTQIKERKTAENEQIDIEDNL